MKSPSSLAVCVNYKNEFTSLRGMEECIVVCVVCQENVDALPTFMREGQSA